MAETTTDHDTIRQWAESKGGKPAAVDRTHQGGDVGIIRLMFPNNPQSEHGSLVEISWDEFFEEFDKRELALLYDEKSLFSKIVGRDTAEKREHGDHAASRHAGRDDGKHGGTGQRTGAQKSPGSEDADRTGARAEARRLRQELGICPERRRHGRLGRGTLVEGARISRRRGQRPPSHEDLRRAASRQRPEPLTRDEPDCVAHGANFR